MKTIRISDEVWNEIVKRGKFGETPSDVIERDWLKKTVNTHQGTSMRKRRAKKRMSAVIEDQKFTLSFSDGLSKIWSLPNPEDKGTFINVREEILTFAKQNEATDGQLAYITKTLNQAGYYVSGPRS